MHSAAMAGLPFSVSALVGIRLPRQRVAGLSAAYRSSPPGAKIAAYALPGHPRDAARSR